MYAHRLLVQVLVLHILMPPLPRPSSLNSSRDGRTRSTDRNEHVSARSDAEYYLCVPRPPNDGMCQADVSRPLRWLGREGAGTGRGSTPEGTERGD